MTVCLGVLGCGPSWPGALRPDDLPRVKTYLADSIRQQLGKQPVKGLSLALIDDQTVVWAEGFGLADEAQRRAADADTLYQIGSVTKVLTASEVLRAVQRGQLGLDQPVSEVVPGFSVRSRFSPAPPLTVRALLAHHSGLPTDILKGMWDDHPASLETFVASLAQEHLVDPPQSVYRYSNVDFAVLGRVLEQVTGLPYATVMQQRFDQLGMASSSTAPRVELAERTAKGYSNGKEQPRLDLRDTSAGSVISSVNDLSRFVSALFADEALLNAQLAPQFAERPLDFGHQVGLGVMLTGLSVPSGVPVVWHDGGYPPFQAVIAMLPSEKLAVVILANSDEAKAFVNTVATEALELLHELKTGEAKPATTAPAPPEVRLPKEELRRLAGRYVMFTGQPSAIDVEGDHLATTLFGQRFSLIASSADTFVPHAGAVLGLVSVPVTSLSVQFQQVDGRDFAVLRGLPAPFPFERVPEVELSDAWRARLGAYDGDSTTLFNFTGAGLREDGGALLLDLTTSGGTGSLALRPISDDQAVVVGLGANEGDTLSVVGDELVLSGFRFRRR
jgi:CubicO group peptidase (beta-lactamase class C family)